MKSTILPILFYLIFSGMYAQKEGYNFDPIFTNQIIKESNYVPAIYEIVQRDLTRTYIQRKKKKNTAYTNLKKELIKLVKDSIKVHQNTLAENHKIDTTLHNLRQKIKSTAKHKKVLLPKKIEKKGSFVLGNKANVNSLSGFYEKVANYHVMVDDHNKFLKSELVKEDIIKKLKISKNHIASNVSKVLITNTVTGAYYLVESEFLEKFNYTDDQRILAQNTYIKKHRKIKITHSNTMAYTIEKYEMMIKRCKELTDLLISHNKIAQQGNMTKNQITDWKRDLVEAKLLSFRIDEFKSMYERENYPLQEYVQQEILDNYDHFSKTLSSVSKNVGF